MRLPRALLVLLATSLCSVVSVVTLVGPASTSAPAARPHAGDVGPLRILLTNDDGWRGASGAATPLIVALREALMEAGHDVTVVASATDQSGQGGRFSLPPTRLDVRRPEPGVWTVGSGSPSDAVMFAFSEIFRESPPDLVISGINPGNNTGQAVSHSGTVNAATTALEFGVPSLAVSMQTVSTWPEGTVLGGRQTSASVVALVEDLQVDARGGKLIPPGVALNLNYPLRPGAIDPATGKPGGVLAPRGIKFAPLDTGAFLDMDYIPQDGVAGDPGSYAIGLSLPVSAPDKGSDVAVVGAGYVSVTPLEADRDLDPSTLAWLRRRL